MKCLLCGSETAVRRFGVTVDGEPLRLQPDFCQEHGDAYLMRVGLAIGEFIRENGESGRPISEHWAAEALASAFADGLLKPSQPDITISGRGASPALQPAGPAPPPEFVEGRFAMPLVTSDELGRRDGPPRAGRGAEFPTDDGSYVVNVIPDPPRAPAASDCPSCDGRGTIYTFVDTRTTDEKRFFACKACDGTGRRKG